MGGQQLKRHKSLTGCHKENSVIASSPGPGDMDPCLRCVLCEAVIRFRQGSEDRFHEHMRNEHEVSSGQMGFLLAMHFSDSRERAVWRDAMRPRIDLFKDGAAQEHTDNSTLEARSPPLSSSPAPTTPSNPPPAQFLAPSPALRRPPIAVIDLSGKHLGHRGDGRQTTGERLLDLSGTPRGPGVDGWRTAGGRLADHLSGRVSHGRGRADGPV